MKSLVTFVKCNHVLIIVFILQWSPWLFLLFVYVGFFGFLLLFGFLGGRGVGFLRGGWEVACVIPSTNIVGVEGEGIQ